MPGRYAFGKNNYGIFMNVRILSDGSLSKTWGQNIRIKGKGKDGGALRRELGLGRYPLVGVASVKAIGRKNARLANECIDPREHDKSIPVFRTVAEECVEEDRERGITNVGQYTQILTDYCFPHVGDMRVDKIRYRDLAFLSSLRLAMPPTARELIRYMKKVFNKCLIMEYIIQNPIDQAFLAELPRDTHRPKHYPALPIKLVPEVMAAIDQPRKTDIATRSCLKAIILNGVRPHSAILAEWREILWKDIHDDSDWDPNGWDPVDWDNLDGSTRTIVWRIPGEHMKKGEPFYIPVSRQFLEILKEMRTVRGQGKRNPNLIFAGLGSGPVAKNGLKRLLRSLGYPSDTEGKPPTRHGFRSTFRTWAEKRNVPREVAEAALAHDIGSKVEIAYMRWDLLEPRAWLNQAYADYATGRLDPGWIWIEPGVASQIEAEKRRADAAERRADEAEKELALVRTELADLRDDFRDIKDMLKSALALKGAA